MLWSSSSLRRSAGSVTLPASTPTRRGPWVARVVATDAPDSPRQVWQWESRAPQPDAPHESGPAVAVNPTGRI